MKSLFILSILTCLVLISGCATNMLHEKINGPSKKEYPTVTKNYFLFSDIENAVLNTSYIPYELQLCVQARIESGPKDNKKTSDIKKYFLSIPVTNDNIYNNLIVDNYTLGCNDNFKSGPNRLAVSLTEVSISAYVPSPSSNHASSFSLDEVVFTGAAGVIIPPDNNLTRKLVYKVNNPVLGGISRYNISVSIRNTIIPIKKKSQDFSSKDLMVVFYPFTIVWDIITTPFIFIYMYANNIH